MSFFAIAIPYPVSSGGVGASARQSQSPRRENAARQLGSVLCWPFQALDDQRLARLFRWFEFQTQLVLEALFEQRPQHQTRVGHTHVGRASGLYLEQVPVNPVRSALGQEVVAAAMGSSPNA